MPKRATGAVTWIDGVARARVTITGRQRKTFKMPTVRTEADAAERAQLLATLARRLRQVDTPQAQTIKALDMAAAATERSLRNVLVVIDELADGKLAPVTARADMPTFRQLGERWTSGELAERYPDQIKVKRSVSDDIGRLDNYVYPVLGEVPIDQITLELCQEVMRRLPPKLAPATRRNIGQLVTRVMSMAVYPLCFIDHSPIPRGFLPRALQSKALAYLYPDEDARLMACGKVPLGYRLLWGFLAREGMRMGEARKLTWADVDLKRGAVRLDRNKSDDPRVWALDPGVAEALRRYRAQYREGDAPAALVFRGENDERLVAPGLADRFRGHLRKIDLDEERPELFESTAERRQIRVHDLRGTFVTIALANGRTESWIADRTGHRSSNMINRYKRQARTVAELGAGDLASLVEALPELAEPLPEPVDCPVIAHEAPGLLDDAEQYAKKSPGTLSDSGACSPVTPTGLEPVLPA